MTNSYLSYEVDKSTAISTLRGWIERDTKLKPQAQILLTSVGEKIDSNALAYSYHVENEVGGSIF